MGYGPVIPDFAGARITLLPDGRFRINAGVVDMGQGNNPTSVQIACSILNQNPEQFELVQPDTFQGIPSCSSAGSRTTFTYGNALISAAHRIRDLILDQVVERNPGIRKDSLELLPGRIHHLPDGKEFSLGEIASGMPEPGRTVLERWTAPVNRQQFPVSDLVKIFGFPKLIYSFAVHAARVEIDELTGEVRVDAYLSCTDAGNILNPQVAEQQIQGAVAQGIGYALYEDFLVRDGITLTKNLSTYIIPASLDLPDFTSITVDTYEEAGPFGLKGIGEIGIAPPLPCIANAVTGATGDRILRYPLTPERVLGTIRRVR
jgi:CO/xanthine dehydrogenase Mo-binding subunit